MKNVFLETKRVIAFREAMGVVEDVEKGQPGLAVVWGKPGRGKTECAREYAVRTGAVYLRVMEDWTPRAMLSKLCSEINDMEPGTVDRCKKIIVSELDMTVRTILVDEADRLKVTNIEHLRDIHDLTGAPVVFIGEPSIYAVINSRRRIWSRVTRTVEFGPIVPEDVLLLGLKAADLKISPEAAHRLTRRSEGDFRLLWLDMRDLERVAKANSTQEITEEMVQALPPRKPGPKADMIPKRRRR